MRDIFIKIRHNINWSLVRITGSNTFHANLISNKTERQQKMNKKVFDGFYFTSALIVILIFSESILAQKTSVSVNRGEEESFLWWYIVLSVLVISLIVAVVWWYRGKNQEKQKAALESKQKKENSWDNSSVDADRELEWLRKNQRLVDKKRKKTTQKKQLAKTAETAEEVIINEINVGLLPKEPAILPVFEIEKLEPAAEFTPLPMSRDEALISAIEQAYEEYEEDEEVRDLSLRILMAFKTRNSVEALSQLALYDLSSALRSKAVITLMELNHESVFETILLACADPTREVRASAARGLTRLGFDRADAWARIIETKEPGRIRQAARAAIESGFVARSFDRLVHHDKQAAYESFVLLALLLRANETEQIFDALRNHKNIKVKEAILHLFKVTKDENALNGLYSLADVKSLPQELKSEVDKTINEFGLVAV